MFKRKTKKFSNQIYEFGSIRIVNMRYGSLYVNDQECAFYMFAVNFSGVTYELINLEQTDNLPSLSSSGSAL